MMNTMLCVLVPVPVHVQVTMFLSWSALLVKGVGSVISHPRSPPPFFSLSHPTISSLHSRWQLFCV